MGRANLFGEGDNDDDEDDNDDGGEEYDNTDCDDECGETNEVEGWGVKL